MNFEDTMLNDINRTQNDKYLSSVYTRELETEIKYRFDRNERMGKWEIRI